jgi:hypothetical protein
MIKKTILASLLFTAVCYAQSSKPKNVYKLTHLSPSEAIITCQNGADPTFKNLTGNAVMVSCGPSLRATWDGKKFTCPAGLFVWADQTEATEGKDDYAYCGAFPVANSK